MRYLLLLCALCIPLCLHAVPLVRTEHIIELREGGWLHVREVAGKPGPPILLVHGARIAGLASFDLPVPGGSLAGDLANLGFDVYVVDIRGYGSSSLPPAMNTPPEGKPALIRSSDAVKDIDEAVDFIRARHGKSRPTLLGWATGGQWAGHYASLHSEKIRGLIVMNSLYRGNAPHALIGRGSGMEDPAKPGTFNRAACGAYRFNDAASIMRPWDASIPGEDKALWRDPEVARAFVEAALQADRTSVERTPRSARSPCGALEDSFYLASGRQLWDASLIEVPVLVLRGERDFWSRAEDMANLTADLVHSPAVRAVTLPDTSHFVHLERASKGRDLLLKEIADFLNKYAEQP
jgi:pimeloyl-ACP methyl ester carboxylesterase